MSAFTEKEIEYLRGQLLGRLATVGSDRLPHVVPVGFRLDVEAEAIEIGGHALSSSKKWRDLQANPRVAFVVDDSGRSAIGSLQAFLLELSSVRRGLEPAQLMTISTGWLSSPKKRSPPTCAVTKALP